MLLSILFAAGKRHAGSDLLSLENVPSADPVAACLLVPLFLLFLWLVGTRMSAQFLSGCTVIASAKVYTEIPRWRAFVIFLELCIGANLRCDTFAGATHSTQLFSCAEPHRLQAQPLFSVPHEARNDAGLYLDALLYRACGQYARRATRARAELCLCRRRRAFGALSP